MLPVRQELTTDADGRAEARITFAADPSAAYLCSACGLEAEPVHSYRLRRIRDLSLAHATVELLVPHRNVRCERCGIRTEAHDFLAPYRRATRRLEAAVADLCRVLPVRQVARHSGPGWHTVKAIDKRRLEHEVGAPDYDRLRLLAVDEIAVSRRIASTAAAEGKEAAKPSIAVVYVYLRLPPCAWVRLRARSAGCPTPGSKITMYWSGMTCAPGANV